MEQLLLSEQKLQTNLSGEIYLSDFQEVKVSSPDYKNIPSEEAFKDFNARIKHYQDFYIKIDLDKERLVYCIDLI